MARQVGIGILHPNHCIETLTGSAKANAISVVVDLAKRYCANGGKPLSAADAAAAFLHYVYSGAKGKSLFDLKNSLKNEYPVAILQLKNLAYFDGNNCNLFGDHKDENGVLAFSPEAFNSLPQ
jgi:hypothetical protein